MSLYDLVSSLSNTQFPLFFLILFIAVIFLFGTKFLLKLSTPYFFLGIIGLIIGLIIGSLVSSYFTHLPAPLGTWFPPILNIFITVAFLDLFLAQGKSLNRIIFKYSENVNDDSNSKNSYVLDTSILIDSRIIKVVDRNFLAGHFLISSLVIKELQKMADSEDNLKRLKGRRGFETLSALNHHQKVSIEVINQFKKNTDNALVELAHDKKCKIVTCDIALSKIASLSSVTVLNLAELAESLTPILIPGEIFKLYIRDQGRAKNQGVGYLSDGTMVIVQGGSKYIGQKLDVRVEKVHQTTTGTIIFSILQ